MGIADDILGQDGPLTPEGWHAALAALAWQVDLGVAEVTGDLPVPAYELPAEVARPARAASTGGAPSATPTPAPAVARPAPANPEELQDIAVAEARALAAAAPSLDALREAMAGFEHCELKRGARNLVFSDGNPKARVMILGEAPGAEEDREGRPFVGRAGQLLDRMLAAIGLSRQAPDAEQAAYITNVMVWRPPGNRDPSPEEIAMMLPFVERHIALVDPDVLLLMGNTPCTAILGQRGILRLRGKWTQGLGRAIMPMTHPAYLLRNPIAKREAWADLLEIRAKLEGK